MWSPPVTILRSPNLHAKKGEVSFSPAGRAAGSPVLEHPLVPGSDLPSPLPEGKKKRFLLTNILAFLCFALRNAAPGMESRGCDTWCELGGMRWLRHLPNYPARSEKQPNLPQSHQTRSQGPLQAAPHPSIIRGARPGGAAFGENSLRRFARRRHRFTALRCTRGQFRAGNKFIFQGVAVLAARSQIKGA